MNSIGLGNEISVVDEQGDRRWALRIGEDAVLTLVRFDAAGLQLDTPVVIANTGGVTVSTLTTTTIAATNAPVNYRVLANDVVPTITRADQNGVIELLNTTAAVKAINTDITGDDAVVLGMRVTFFLAAATSNSYILALSTGTLTLDAARECATVVRTSLGWNVVSLQGATIV